MSGIRPMLWAIFASALFSSNAWQPEPRRCTSFLHAKGTPEPARILIQLPLMDSINENVPYFPWLPLKGQGELQYLYGNMAKRVMCSEFIFDDVQASNLLKKGFVGA
jgi:hypothetical protein